MGSTEVAALLGVNPATVARAVQSGRLIASEVTPGGHHRFSAADVEAFRRRAPRRSRRDNVIQLRELADLPNRIGATVRAKHGIELTENDWRALLSRLDHLADAIVEILGRSPGNGASPARGARVSPPPAEPVSTGAGPGVVAAPPAAPSLPAVEPIQRKPAVPLPPPASLDSRRETTRFEDGKSGITLIVGPIERFALIETISALLGSVQGVEEIRLRRLQRGVASFTIRYAGPLPASVVFPRALTSLGASVTASGERLFEATLSKSEPVAASGPPTATGGS